MKTDVNQPADVKAMVDRTRDVLGKLDILVNNAGMAAPPALPFMKQHGRRLGPRLRRQHQVRVPACKAVAPYFIERRPGRIINIASIAGPLSAAHHAALQRGQAGASSRSRAWWPRSWRPIASP